MKHIIITTSKCRLLVVDLPEGANPDICCGRCCKPNTDPEDCWSAKECSRYTDFIIVNKDVSWSKDGNRFDLPPGNWQLLRNPEDVSEAVAIGIVKDKEEKRYWDYIGDTPLFKETYFENPATLSFMSLLESEISLTNPLGEEPELPIEPLEGNSVFPSQGDIIRNEKYLNDLSAWCAAEEKVFHNPILLYEPK